MRKSEKKKVVTKLDGLEVVIFVKLNSCEKLYL